MIGDMISKIRTEKGLSKTELANKAGINLGHLTHIEKGERNPSRNTLKNICKALDIPYQPLLYTLGKTIKDENVDYSLVDYIPYNKIIAVDNIDSLIDCPSTIPSASIAIKANDKSMETTIACGKYIYVEFNTVLNNKDIGLFYLNNKFLIRRFYSKSGKITLKADNPSFQNININENDNFYIVGKVVG